MPLKDGLHIDVQKYSTSDKRGVYYKEGDGIFGISWGDDAIWISKTDEVGNKLWDVRVQSTTTAYRGGIVLVTDDRIYFRDRVASPNRIVWIPYTSNPIQEYPPLTEVISYGPSSQQLHGSSDYWWCGTLYGTQYIFHCDTGAHRIVVTDLDGNYIGEFGSYGSGFGELNYPTQVNIVEPGIIAVNEEENRRISFWQIKSWSPFSVDPIVGGVESSQIPSNYYPEGVAVWKNKQLYTVFYRSAYPADTDIWEFEINDDYSTTAQSTTYDISNPGGYGVWCGESKAVISHTQQGCRIYNVRTINNVLEEQFEFDIYAMISGVGIDILFSLDATSPGINETFGFSLDDAQAATQHNEFDENFFFSIEAEGGPYNMISEFGFELTAGEYGVIDSFGFELTAAQNYGENVFSFEIYTETGQEEFSTFQQSFEFELLASSPHSGGVNIELETLELHAAAAQDLIGTMELVVEPLEVEAYEGLVGHITLSSLQTTGVVSAPTSGSAQLIVPELMLSATASVPVAAAMRLGLEGLIVSGLGATQGQLNGGPILPALATHGIMSMGASSGQISATLDSLKIESWAAVVPEVSASLVIPALRVEANQQETIYSISELYDGNNIVYISGGDYTQVDLSSLPDLEQDIFDIQGVVINLTSHAISKIGYPSTYNVIDLGYLDVHRLAVNDYLVVFLYGDIPTEEDSVGRLIVGDYSYEIKRWISDGEWRVVVGRGLTKRFLRDPSKRYQRLLIQLKSGFELKGLTIFATPNPRRLR